MIRRAPEDSFQALESRLHLNNAFIANWGMPPAGVFVQPLVADMNGDGRADIVQGANNSGPSVGFARSVTVYLSRGDGTFDAVPAVGGDQGNGPRALGDFDGDGDVDALISTTIFTNNGSGVLTATAPSVLIRFVAFYESFDFDADGDDDLISIEDSRVTVVLGSHTGLTMGPSLELGSAYQFNSSASLVDLDGDDDLDMALFSTTTPNIVRLVFNDRTSLRAVPSMTLSNQALGDATDDDKADLIGFTVLADGSLQINVAPGNGDGTFGPPEVRGRTLPFSMNVTATGQVTDLNGDGRRDLIVNKTTGNLVTQHVILSESNGMYRSGATPLGMSTTSGDGASFFGAADFDGDDDLDPWGLTTTEGAYTNVVISRTVPAPMASSVTFGANRVLPLEPVGMNARLDPAGLPVMALTMGFYIDSDGDGQVTSADRLIGTGTPSSGDPLVYEVTYVHRDIVPFGATNVLALATFDGGQSLPAQGTIDFWTRVFYPEGFRNDNSINEYVSLDNRHDSDVSYRVIVHYETGDRDQIIAEGTIAAHSRGGITASEHQNPAGALVRAGVGYAIELQSSLPLGAALAHYDNFSTDPSSGTAIGEAFTYVTSTGWSFADLSTVGFEFLVFYNPTDTDATATVRFFDAAQGSVSVTVPIPALRRAGLALRDLSVLDPNTSYAATISSTVAIVAAVSRYTVTGEGYGAMGSRGSTTLVMPGLEIRAGLSHQLVLFNAANTAQDITIELAFGDSGTTTSRTLLIQARARVVINPLTGAPASALHAALRLSGVGFISPGSWGVLATFFSTDATRGDSTGTAFAETGATTWAFGDAFLSRTTAGVNEFENLYLYNNGTGEQDVTVRFMFTNGDIAERVVHIGSRRSTRLQVDRELPVLNHDTNNWFGIVVIGNDQLICSLEHWDLAQRGGWMTLGGNQGTSTQLA